MQKKCLFLLYVIIITFKCHSAATVDHIITFFIQPYSPYEMSEQKVKENSDKLKQTLATPGKVSYKIAKSLTPSSSAGIFVTYSGYLVASSMLGQITFPRLTQQPSLKVIITEQIEPVMMIGNTVHHWELSKNTPAEMFTLERKEDPETKLVYWDYKETSLPADTIIPLNAIVILTKPKNIVVPLGITLTNNNQHWILPTIYAIKNINTLEPALSALKVRQFFGPINIVRKKASDTNFATQISTQ